MERREHRPAVAALHGDALHVHRRVDEAEAQPHAGEDGVQGGPAGHRAGGRDRGAHERATRTQHDRAAEPGGEGTGEHAADAGDDRYGQQDQRQLGVAEAELLLEHGYLGQQAGEAQALHEVRSGHARAGPPVPGARHGHLRS